MRRSTELPRCTWRELTIFLIELNRHHQMLIGGAFPHDVGLTAVMVGSEIIWVKSIGQKEHDVRRRGDPVLVRCGLHGKGIRVAGIAAARQHVPDAEGADLGASPVNKASLKAIHTGS